MGLFKRKPPERVVPRLVDYEALMAGNITAPFVLDLHARWERFSKVLEPGEKRSAVLRAHILTAANPATGEAPRLIGPGQVYFTDRRMLIDMDVWSERGVRLLAAPSTSSMEYSELGYFGPYPVTDRGWIVMSKITDDNPTAQVFGWAEPANEYILDGLVTAIHLMRSRNGFSHEDCVCNGQREGKVSPFERPITA